MTTKSISVKVMLSKTKHIFSWVLLTMLLLLGANSVKAQQYYLVEDFSSAQNKFYGFSVLGAANADRNGIRIVTQNTTTGGYEANNTSGGWRVYYSPFVGQVLSLY